MSTAILSAHPSSVERSSFVRLHVASKICGVSTSTVRRLCNSQLVECRRTPVGGHRLVNLSEVCEVVGVSPPAENNAEENQEMGGRIVLAYARVSTNKQKQEGNLARQIERLKAFCAENYPGQTVKVISEVGSGLSDTRPGFLKMCEMLAAGKLSALVVEWQDRCARFGVGVIKRLCEAKQTAFIETRTGTEEEKALTAEQEMSRDILSIVTVFANKASGKKGGMAVKIVPPPEFHDFVVRLAGSGMSRRDIVAEVQKRKFVCQNTSKILGERSVRNVLESLPAAPVIPATVKTFIGRRCVVGASKRETTAALYDAYCEHCGTAQPLNRDRWTAYLKQAVRGLTLDNGKVTTAYGICLRAGRPA